MKIFWQFWAFFKKNLLIKSAYRINFLIEIGSALVSIITFFFISKLLGNTASSYLQSYGGNYFSFVLIGLALQRLLSLALNNFAATVSTEQSIGTLEAILTTKIKPLAWLLISPSWDWLWTIFMVIFYLAFGILFFKVHLIWSHLGYALIILIFSCLAFSGLGILSASIIMITKRGNPLNWLIGGLSTFLGGVYFPIQIFPDWLQKIAFFVPTNQALQGIRKALLTDTSAHQLLTPILFLIIFTVIFLPVSFYIFSKAIKIAKKQGSLTHF